MCVVGVGPLNVFDVFLLVWEAKLDGTVNNESQGPTSSGEQLSGRTMSDHVATGTKAIVER